MMREFTDQLYRKVSLANRPERIVSLVPSQTELLVDLGLKDQLKGITKFCVHPEGLRKEKRVVGGTKKIHFDRVKALAPDIILCNKEENTPEMVEVLEKIAPVHVSDVKNIEDSLQLTTQYGEMFEVQTKAEEISRGIEERLERFRNETQQLSTKRVAYLIWRRPWMAAGKNTFIDTLLQLNGLNNVFSVEEGRYPETTVEEIKQREVELLLLSTEPFPFKEKHKEELQQCLSNQAIEIVDGEYFSWYGSRLLKAFEYFRRIQDVLRSTS